MDFGYKKKHNFDFGKKSEPTHCGRCMRTKEEAIEEQVSFGVPCDDSNCVFVNSIRLAIEQSQYSQFCINCGHKFVSINDNYCTNCGFKKYT